MKSSKNFLSYEWSYIILAEFVSNWQLFEVYYLFRPIPLATISHYYQIAPKQIELGIRATTHFEDFFIFF